MMTVSTLPSHRLPMMVDVVLGRRVLLHVPLGTRKANPLSQTLTSGVCRGGCNGGCACSPTPAGSS